MVTAATAPAEKPATAPCAYCLHPIPAGRYDDTGRWRHLPGCLSLTAEAKQDEPAASLDAWTRRPPLSDRHSLKAAS